MGFKALNQVGDAIYSFTMDDHQWKDFKSKHKQQYKMSCCDAVAIPKTSAKGTKFFSHHSQGNCNHKPESAEHMFCKYVLILALRDVGWSVETERRGQTPSGEVWIADVYAEKENAKVVFEVQWSGITLDEITRRNNKYIESGIRCVWLKRNKNISMFDLLSESNRSLTIFGINEKDIGIFGLHDDAGPYICKMINVALPISQFIEKLMSGQIKYALNKTDSFIARPSITRLMDCNHCGSKVNALRSFSVFNRNGVRVSLEVLSSDIDFEKSDLDVIIDDNSISIISSRVDKHTIKIDCPSCFRVLERHISWQDKELISGGILAKLNNIKRPKSVWLDNCQDYD